MSNLQQRGIRQTVRGITANVKTKDADALILTNGQRLHQWMIVPANASMVLMALGIFAIFLSRIGVAYLAVFAALWLKRFFLGQRETLTLKIPIQEGLIDGNELSHKTDDVGRVPVKGKGIFFLGNELFSGKELWVTNDDCRQHILVMGTTGAGKTELLLSFVANALSWGSGVIFIDGKGDIKTMVLMYAMSKLWGRDGSFLLLNFMPPPKETEKAQGENISNTMNAYTVAEADDIKQQVNGMLPPAGPDGHWRDRAMAMLEAVLLALVWARDSGILTLSLQTLRHFIQLKNLASMVLPVECGGDIRFQQMPMSIKENLRVYLSSCGPFNFSSPGDKQDPEVAKQHGYLEGQLTGAFSALINQYGAIFDTDYGEVEMVDVVLNRRILLALIPALAKNPDDVQRMGKIIVGALKSMMGKMLGNLGYIPDPSVRSLLEIRVASSPSPVIGIFDECGLYLVAGMATIAAQARSLGFCMVYAAQDIKAMTKFEDKEAYSIIANTNLKIIMRSEDSDTAEMAVKMGGKAIRVRARSYERTPAQNESLFGSNWRENEQKAAELESRIDELDLKNQDAGEFTAIYKAIIVRGKGLFTDALQAYKDSSMVPMAPNQFIVVTQPDMAIVETREKMPAVVASLMSYDTLDKREEVDRELAREADEIFNLGVIWKTAQELPSRKNSRETKPIDAATTLVAGAGWRYQEATGGEKMQFHGRRNVQPATDAGHVAPDVGAPDVGDYDRRTGSAGHLAEIEELADQAVGGADTSALERSMSELQDRVAEADAHSDTGHSGFFGYPGVIGEVPDDDDEMASLYGAEGVPTDVGLLAEDDDRQPRTPGSGIDVDNRGLQCVYYPVEDARVRQVLASVESNVAFASRNFEEGDPKAHTVVSDGINRALGLPTEDQQAEAMDFLRQSMSHSSSATEGVQIGAFDASNLASIASMAGIFEDAADPEVQATTTDALHDHALHDQPAPDEDGAGETEGVLSPEASPKADQVEDEAAGDAPVVEAGTEPGASPDASTPDLPDLPPLAPSPAEAPEAGEHEAMEAADIADVALPGAEGGDEDDDRTALEEMLGGQLADLDAYGLVDEALSALPASGVDGEGEAAAEGQGVGLLDDGALDPSILSALSDLVETEEQEIVIDHADASDGEDAEGSRIKAPPEAEKVGQEQSEASPKGQDAGASAHRPADKEKPRGVDGSAAPADEGGFDLDSFSSLLGDTSADDFINGLGQG